MLTRRHGTRSGGSLPRCLAVWVGASLLAAAVLAALLPDLAVVPGCCTVPVERVPRSTRSSPSAPPYCWPAARVGLAGHHRGGAGSDHRTDPGAARVPAGPTGLGAGGLRRRPRRRCRSRHRGRWARRTGGCSPAPGRRGPGRARPGCRCPTWSPALRSAPAVRRSWHRTHRARSRSPPATRSGSSPPTTSPTMPHLRTWTSTGDCSGRSTGPSSARTPT